MLPSTVYWSSLTSGLFVADATPFLGAFLADQFLGEYLTMILATLLCYIPGLALIALTSVPRLLGPHFSLTATRLGFLVLWPIGTGAVKACVNVFGAKQVRSVAALSTCSVREARVEDHYSSCRCRHCCPRRR